MKHLPRHLLGPAIEPEHLGNLLRYNRRENDYLIAYFLVLPLLAYHVSPRIFKQVFLLLQKFYYIGVIYNIITFAQRMGDRNFQHLHIISGFQVS